ncbi:hypothetical protein BNJ_00343 [Kaumoebavirus]|uniref:hypothetical protein n=1 Tax=Kaumoebavirus TaxID=1859492 RepID=UPI0009C385C0|nr:hypothetical protein BNJ_00343 [Kaumoebavirus]ARA72163.1 hypothetical protein BNJ_00343 [Kaumoebavirus]
MTEMQNENENMLRTIIFSWKPVVKKNGEKFKFSKLWGNLTTADPFEGLPNFMRNILPKHIEVDEDICHYRVDFSNETEPRVIFNLEVGDVEEEELQNILSSIHEVVHHKKMYYSTEHVEDEENDTTIFTLFLKLDNIQYS